MSALVLVALFVTLIPTTIGALLSAIDADVRSAVAAFSMQTPSASVPFGVLRRMIDRTQFATAREPGRFALHGVQFRFTKTELEVDTVLVSVGATVSGARRRPPGGRRAGAGMGQGA